MSNSDYTIAVGPYIGAGPTQELTFYTSWSLDKNLDDGCTFSFTIPGYVPEAAAISELDTDVWVYRAGVLDDRFRIVAINQSWGPSGEDVLSVQAVCYRRLLAARYVQTPLRFDQVSQGQIIWELIQHTQATTNGDLGITAGSLGPTVLRDRSYEVGQNILDIIVDMTNVIGGPTWDIDANLQLVVSRSDLYPLNPAPLVLGATVEAFQRPSAASKFGNATVVSGNNQSTLPVIAESPTLTTDPRGRWERRASYPSVVLQNTLQNHAEGLLTDLQSPSAIWQVDVVPSRFFGDGQYKLGDFVEIVQPASTAAPIGPPAVSVFGQVLAIQVQQAANGAVDVSMRVLEIGTAGVTVFGEASDVTAGGFRTVTWTNNGFIRVVGTALEDVDYLIVGGGGAGGSAGSIADTAGGGGGAGGVLSGTIASMLLTYDIEVGAGGVGSATVPATNGNPSKLGETLIAYGGGAGGVTSTAGSNGASGGGAGSGGTTSSGLTGQGYGGGSSASTVSSAGGGGGAGGAGGNGTTSAAGNGGIGFTSTISGSSVVYAGGGAGGRYPGDSAGTTEGGGGAGGNNSAGSNGTNGRGAGGGGAGRDTGGPYKGGDGGSGVVILRWAV